MFLPTEVILLLNIINKLLYNGWFCLVILLLCIGNQLLCDDLICLELFLTLIPVKTTEIRLYLSVSD